MHGQSVITRTRVSVSVISDCLAAGSSADHNAPIVVGRSSQAAHRLIGSIAVSLARHPPVPLMIVP